MMREYKYIFKSDSDKESSFDKSIFCLHNREADTSLANKLIFIFYIYCAESHCKFSLFVEDLAHFYKTLPFCLYRFKCRVILIGTFNELTI